MNVGWINLSSIQLQVNLAWSVLRMRLQLKSNLMSAVLTVLQIKSIDSVCKIYDHYVLLMSVIFLPKRYDSTKTMDQSSF